MQSRIALVRALGPISDTPCRRRSPAAFLPAIVRESDVAAALTAGRDGKRLSRPLRQGLCFRRGLSYMGVARCSLSRDSQLEPMPALRAWSSKMTTF
jgi:hypothetical protein